MRKRKNGGKQFVFLHKQIREIKKTSQFTKLSTRNNVDKEECINLQVLKMIKVQRNKIRFFYKYNLFCFNIFHKRCPYPRALSE